MGLETANFAEFMAVLLAVELAHNKAWRRVWFETDSSLTLYIFDKKDHVPHSKIRRRWERCMHLLAEWKSGRLTLLGRGMSHLIAYPILL